MPPIGNNTKTKKMSSLALNGLSLLLQIRGRITLYSGALSNRSTRLFGPNIARATAGTANAPSSKQTNTQLSHPMPIAVASHSPDWTDTPPSHNYSPNLTHTTPSPVWRALSPTTNCQPFTTTSPTTATATTAMP